MTTEDRILKPVKGYYWYNAAERLIAIHGVLGKEADRSLWILITTEEKNTLEAQWQQEEKDEVE